MYRLCRFDVPGVNSSSFVIVGVVGVLGVLGVVGVGVFRAAVSGVVVAAAGMPLDRAAISLDDGDDDPKLLNRSLVVVVVRL